MKISTVSRIPVRGRRLEPQAIRDYDAPAAHRPAIDEWIAMRLLAGMHPKAVVVASGHVMALRTAYRWKRELVALEVVEPDGRQATFAIRRGVPPARISPWRPLARAAS